MNGRHATPDELQSFIEGSLSPDEKEKTAAHLELCPGCASRYRFLRALDGAVRNLPLAAAGPGITDAVMAKLDLSHPPSRAFRIVTWLAYQAGLLVVAAAMLWVFVLTGMIQPDRVRAGTSMPGWILGKADEFVTSWGGAVAAWMRGLLPASTGGSLPIFAGMGLALLLLLLIDRNISRRTLHRIR